MSNLEEKKTNNITAEDLYEAIGGVDEELLARAECVRGTGTATHSARARRKLLRYIPLAAAAVVMISLTGLWMTMRRSGMGSTAPAMQEAATEAPEAVEEAAMEEAAEIPAESVEEAAATAEYDPAQEDAGAPAGGLLGDTVNAPAMADQKTEFGATKDAGGSAAAESADALESSTEAARSGSDEVENMRMQVSDGTHTIVFQLNDSPSAKSLFAQLPFDATVENYGSNEKIFTPPSALDKTGGIEGGGKAGGIAYFSPWGNIAMYYGDFSAYPGLYLLGEATAGAEHIGALSGTVHFTAAE